MPVSETARHRVDSQGLSGNPSSQHVVGVHARRAINRVRKQVSDHIGSDDPRQVYFTSGATEAANLVIQGYLRRLRDEGSNRNEIIVSAVEHPAVYQTAYAMERWGYRIREIPVNREGYVELGELESRVGPSTAMVCVMAVNNETGVIQPINTLARAVKGVDPGILFVCDAVQTFAKLRWDIDLHVVDSVFMSGHKIGAEKGTGCLYLNRRFSIAPMFYGGVQEGSFRPGTENVRGIALFGEALQENVEVFQDRFMHVQTLRRSLIAGLSERGILFQQLGAMDRSSPYILMLAFPGVPARIMLEDLDALGFCVSRGSACSSHKRTPSRVLSAMAVPESLSNCAIRISFSGDNQSSEVEALLEALAELGESS